MASAQRQALIQLIPPAHQRHEGTVGGHLEENLLSPAHTPGDRLSSELKTQGSLEH